MDSYWLVVVLALAVVVSLSLWVIKWIWFTKRVSKNTFLLVGLCDAGKTVLYHQLRYGQTVETCTSIKENEGSFVLHSEKGNARPLHLVDLPGHEKQRFRFTEYAPVAGGLVFLIDLSTVAGNVRGISEYLYDILSDAHFRRNRTPILIACNKSDLVTDMPEKEIRTILEKEMEQLRKTRSASPEQLQSSSDAGSSFLGFEDKPFEFADLKNRVDFVRLSATKFENTHSVTQWLRRLYSV